MRDALITVRDYLATKTGLTALTGSGKRLVAGRNLPAGYKPEQGACLLFNIRAGTLDYTGGMWAPSVQFRAYAETEVAAWDLAQALQDAVHDTSYPAGYISRFRLEDGTIPVLLTEPGSLWPYVLSFYRVHIRA